MSKKAPKKQADINQQIKDVLEDIKLDLTIELKRIKPQTNLEQRQKELWNQFYQEEKLVKNNPIKQSIDKKQADADMGMWFKEIHYTPEEQRYLDTNPHEQKMSSLIEEIERIEDKEYELLKQRLKTKQAHPEEIRQYENVEMTIWDSGKQLLGDKGNDLPAFSVDSEFYEVFSNSDGFWNQLNRKIDCKLRGKLNQLGYDYEDYSYSDKTIYDIGEKVPKSEFLKKHSYCKESDFK